MISACRHWGAYSPTPGAQDSSAQDTSHTAVGSGPALISLWVMMEQPSHSSHPKSKWPWGSGAFPTLKSAGALEQSRVPQKKKKTWRGNLQVSVAPLMHGAQVRTDPSAPPFSPSTCRRSSGAKSTQTNECAPPGTHLQSIPGSGAIVTVCSALLVMEGNTSF